MDTTAIIVAIVAVVFMGIMGGLIIYSNTPEKKKDKQD